MVRLLGGDPGDVMERDLDFDVDPGDDETCLWFLEQVGDAVTLMEVNGFEVSRPEVLRRLSSESGLVHSAYWNIERDFDVGHSRSRPWQNRPQAAALLAELPNPARRFNAIVGGEYERAFSGDQLTQLAPLLRRHGVQVWLPETNGPSTSTTRPMRP